MSFCSFGCVHSIWSRSVRAHTETSETFFFRMQHFFHTVFSVSSCWCAEYIPLCAAHCGTFNNSNHIMSWLIHWRKKTDTQIWQGFSYGQLLYSGVIQFCHYCYLVSNKPQCLFNPNRQPYSCKWRQKHNPSIHGHAVICSATENVVTTK